MNVIMSNLNTVNCTGGEAKGLLLLRELDEEIEKKPDNDEYQEYEPSALKILALQPRIFDICPYQIGGKASDK